MDKKEWDYLFHERIAIMVESGMPELRARQQAAWDDTIFFHGERPKNENKFNDECQD